MEQQAFCTFQTKVKTPPGDRRVPDTHTAAGRAGVGAATRPGIQPFRPLSSSSSVAAAFGVSAGPKPVDPVPTCDGRPLHCAVHRRFSGVVRRLADHERPRRSHSRARGRPSGGAFKAGDHPLDEQWLDSATVSEARGGAEETVCAATDAHARRRDPAGWPAVASRGWPPPLSIPRQGACVSDVMPLL